jgi:hypothetical protein
MRKNVLLVATACLGLAACGGSGSENQSAEAPPPLYENPPFGASDIDATVAETRKRMQPSAPAGQESSAGNAQDVAPNSDSSNTTN